MSSNNSVRTLALKNAAIRSNRKKKERIPTKGIEKTCVDNFRHLGQSEVETPLGYIDLLTETYLVEFKLYTRAKDALGQVLCYKQFISDRVPLIVLFGKGLSSWKGKEVFKRVCTLYKVEVFYLISPFLYKDLATKLTS